MTAKARAKAKRQVKKLKLRKDTLKDLDPKRTGRDVKAGRAGLTTKTICGQLVPCI